MSRVFTELEYMLIVIQPEFGVQVCDLEAFVAVWQQNSNQCKTC